MKKMKTQGRQGDVLITRKDHLKLRPETKARLFGLNLKTKVDFKKEGRIILAYGEVSGHEHKLKDNSATLLCNKDVQETVKYLKTAQEVPLTHEEHEAFIIPAESDAVVTIQVEHRLNKIQRTAD